MKPKLTEEQIKQLIKCCKEIRDAPRGISKVYVYVLPNELEFYPEEELSRRIGKEVKIFAVNDRNKYDPTNKSKKARPGRPAIYLE